MDFIKKTGVILLSLYLTGCAERSSLAPVVESPWRRANHAATYHKVARGETLYSIAFRYDQDYRRLAQLNHLSPSYALKAGQVLRLRAVKTPVKARSRQQVSRFHFTPSVVFHHHWVKPATGSIMEGFTPTKGQKGITIAGHRGDKIRAAKAGVVAYAGDGIAGYGHLIIIKHDSQYLTAYGYNARNLVKQGDHIKAGQVIAEMGLVDRRYWGLHFEIRKAGSPVNPQYYIS